MRRTPRSRFTPRVAAGLRIEERDEKFLCDLFLQRAMSRGQIQRLYFGSLVRCNARLRQLFDHQFVARYYPPVSPFGAQAIYLMGPAAGPLVARRLEMDLAEVKRGLQRTKTPTFLEHTLAIVEIWMAFREAITDYPCIEMESWLAEMQCRHEWDIRASGGSWRKEAFKPDAFVRLETPNGYRNFFIEADLGHTSSRQFIGKLMTHQRYLESGLFYETYGGDAFQTLVITTGERRLRNLTRLVESCESNLFWSTSFERITSQGILSAIWSLPNFRHEVGLLWQ